MGQRQVASAGLGRRRLRRPAAAARERVRSGRSRSGTRPASRRTRASPRGSVPVRARGARSGSAATACTTRRWPPRRRRRRRPTSCCAGCCAAPTCAGRSSSRGAVRRATLYATARGVLELELNGTRVGDAVLAPGWTDYRDADRVRGARRHRAPARRRERARRDPRPRLVRRLRRLDPLRRATTTARDPALLCELHLEHADGSVEVIASDERWRATTGPLEYSDLLMGERYDARRELGPWTPVDRARPRDDVPLVPERSQPIRVTEDLRPVADHRARAGRARLRPRPEHGRLGRASRSRASAARACSCASPRCSSPTARSTSTTCAARARSTPTCSRAAAERGLRAALHLPRLPLRRGDRPPEEPVELTGRVVHSDTPRSGWFECSDELVNQLWRNINWGQRGNFISVPTDCPQRDERLGWLADAQVFLPTAALNMDVARLRHQVGRRRPRRAVARRRVPRRRAAAGRSSATARRRGPTPASSCRGSIWRRYGDRPARRAPLGRDGALHGLPAAPQPRPAVDGAARQRLRRLARGRRADAARRARDRLLGLRREADGRDGRALGRGRPRRALRAAARGDRRRVQPRVRRR